MTRAYYLDAEASDAEASDAEASDAVVARARVQREAAGLLTGHAAGGEVPLTRQACLAATITPTSRGTDALACLHQAVATATRLTGVDDLREDLDRAPVHNAAGEVIGHVLVPIAVVSDNGPCFRGETFAQAFTGETPLLRHVRTRVRSPQTNGVIERFFGTLKYEHLYRGVIGDGDALAVEVGRFRQLYNAIRPHQALGDQTPRRAYLGE